jgi:hypothetical protein
MQKIKYPVGSTIRTSSGFKLKILDLSKNEYACLVGKEKDHVAYFEKWMTQEQLDEQGYKLVSTPRWTPEKGDEYCTMYSDGSWGRDIWKGDKVDLFRLKTDNVKRTGEECQKKIEEINSREI